MKKRIRDCLNISELLNFKFMYYFLVRKMFRKKLSQFVIGLCTILLPATLLSAGWNSWDECYCERFWFDADYLYWKLKNAPEPVPLVVQGPVKGSGPVLGQPGYSVVLGGRSIENDWRSSGRFSLGCWFDPSQCLGAEIGYFILPTTSKKHSVFSDGTTGSPFLTLPYFDALIEQENSFPLSDPGNFSGTVRLKEKNFMQSAEVNLVTSTACTRCLRYGLLAGLRYWNFTEQLTFDTSSPFIRNPDVFQTQDKFHTQNHFYGAQIGARLDYNVCNFILNIKGKLALGAMCQKLDIHGVFLTNDFTGQLEKFEGGYFALPTNIGSHKKTGFSAIPEVNINVGYQLMECLTFKVGYTIICATNVLWAGKQIDRKINPLQSVAMTLNPDAQLVGEPSPKASLKSECLWIQGWNAGLEFKF